MCHCVSLCLSRENPRGLNAVAPATPTPEVLQAVCQRTCTEALQQLALYAPGAAAMRRDAGVVEALQAVAARGMSKEAQDLAATALLALSDRQPPTGGGSGEGAAEGSAALLALLWLRPVLRHDCPPHRPSSCRRWAV